MKEISEHDIKSLENGQFLEFFYNGINTLNVIGMKPNIMNHTCGGAFYCTQCMMTSILQHHFQKSVDICPGCFLKIPKGPNAFNHKCLNKLV